MPLNYFLSKRFINNYRKLTHKNREFKSQVDNKIEQIIKDPEIGAPKRHDLSGIRGVHIGHFVVTYTVIKDTIVFITINHHDAVYGETSAIYAQLEELYPEIWDKTSAE
ncbi:MAG TPA: type II toxin-antitoxin system mRNA interferase toxin, RelE/StbE family [Methanothrix sp.]|nr:type II toxin-antitoxin system mRNA interferase toxin, RelE/StbE family [Methanothrix sp.]HPR66487.1 type II toxin-antitoxin system mRNA interferase toxin, RelE/StbE family [Methanothrix sp.]